MSKNEELDKMSLTFGVEHIPQHFNELSGPVKFLGKPEDAILVPTKQVEADKAL